MALDLNNNGPLKEFLLAQFESDFNQINHHDKLFHDLMKFYFIIVSALGVAAAWLYGEKEGSLKQGVSFFQAMRLELSISSVVLLILGLVIYVFHLYKRRWNSQGMRSINLTRKAFIYGSTDPLLAAKYSYHPHEPYRFRYGKLLGMDAVYMYIASVINGAMLFLFLYVCFGLDRLGLLIAGSFFVLQVVAYVLCLSRWDRREIKQREKELLEFQVE